MKENNNRSEIVKRLVVSGLFLAMVTALTSIGFPIAGGYIHLGDSMIYACAWAVGGFAGMVAAGVGSMLADILMGYPQYALATLIIKSLMALVCFAIMKKFHYKALPNLLAMVVAAVILVVGYCGFEYFLTGPGGAVAVLYGNILQGIGGIVLGNVIIHTLDRIKTLSPYIKWKADKNNE